MWLCGGGKSPTAFSFARPTGPPLLVSGNAAQNRVSMPFSISHVHGSLLSSSAQKRVARFSIDGMPQLFIPEQRKSICEHARLASWLPPVEILGQFGVRL